MRSGWVGGGFTDEKGGFRKRGGQDPLTPNPLDTPMNIIPFMSQNVTFCLPEGHSWRDSLDAISLDAIVLMFPFVMCIPLNALILRLYLKQLNHHFKNDVMNCVLVTSG